MKQDLKFNRKKAIIFSLSLTLLTALVGSCKKDDDDSSASLIKERIIQMDTKQEIPTVVNRTEKGTATLRVYSDSTLYFSFNVSNLNTSDPLTVAHIHTGSPVDAGPPVITLVDNSTVKFQGNKVTKTIKLTASQFNAIKDDEGDELYVNIHSTNFPLGLIRGQLDKTITFAHNVDLTPISNPLRPETGLAILRMTSDSTLFYKVTVNNLTSGDILSAAQISVGATGVMGPPLIPLYTTAEEFGTMKSLKLSASQVNFLLNSEIYLSVNSQQVTNELIRGQIR